MNHATPHRTTITAVAGAREIVTRPDFRKGIVGGALFAATAVGAGWLGAPRSLTDHAVGLGLTVLTAVFGVLAVRSTASELRRLVTVRGGVSVAGSVHLVVTLVGYVVVLVTLLAELHVPVQRLLLSGAITGVIIGIAAQQSLGNAFAGLVLLFSRPFTVGDYVTLRSGALGGRYDGDVQAITLMYTVIGTDEGPISLPNSGVLAAAAGRRQRPRDGFRAD